MIDVTAAPGSKDRDHFISQLGLERLFNEVGIVGAPACAADRIEMQGEIAQHTARRATSPWHDLNQADLRIDRSGGANHIGDSSSSAKSLRHRHASQTAG